MILRHDAQSRATGRIVRRIEALDLFPWDHSVKNGRYGSLKRMTLRPPSRTELAGVGNGLLVSAAGSKP